MNYHQFYTEQNRESLIQHSKNVIEAVIPQLSNLIKMQVAVELHYVKELQRIYQLACNLKYQYVNPALQYFKDIISSVHTNHHRFAQSLQNEFLIQLQQHRIDEQNTEKITRQQNLRQFAVLLEQHKLCEQRIQRNNKNLEKFKQQLENKLGSRPYEDADRKSCSDNILKIKRDAKLLSEELTTLSSSLDSVAIKIQGQQELEINKRIGLEFGEWLMIKIKQFCIYNCEKIRSIQYDNNLIISRLQSQQNQDIKQISRLLQKKYQ